MTSAEHHCTRFRSERHEGDWQDVGALRSREIERRYVCVECRRIRPRRFRKVIAEEREARSDHVLIEDARLRHLAATLSRLFEDRDELRGGPLLRRLGGVQAETELEALAAAAPIRLVYRPRGGSLHLHAVSVLDRVALTEAAFPGEAARRAVAIQEAIEELRVVTHPEATRIAEILSRADPAWDSRVIRCLTALARLVDAEEAVPARAFSARHLGQSKALATLRPRLEKIVGPLERLGIRDAGSVVLVGGSGVLELSDRSLRLDGLRYLGLAPQDVERLLAVTPPAHGVLIVENLTAFHACLDAATGRPLMIIWSGGFPSRGVASLIRKLAARCARIRAWCDLDLGGVRIVRLVSRLTDGRLEPALMSVDDVLAATHPVAMSPEQHEAVRRDLARNPDALLAETLRALHDSGVWVEQETQLERIRTLLE